MCGMKKFSEQSTCNILCLKHYTIVIMFAESKKNIMSNLLY